MTPGETSAHLSVFLYFLELISEHDHHLLRTQQSYVLYPVRRPWRQHSIVESIWGVWWQSRSPAGWDHPHKVAADITAAPRGGRANILTLPCFHRDQRCLQGLWEQTITDPKTRLAESCLAKFFFFPTGGALLLRPAVTWPAETISQPTNRFNQWLFCQLIKVTVIKFLQGENMLLFFVLNESENIFTQYSDFPSGKQVSWSLFSTSHDLHCEYVSRRSLWIFTLFLMAARSQLNTRRTTSQLLLLLIICSENRKSRVKLMTSCCVYSQYKNHHNEES